MTCWPSKALTQTIARPRGASCELDAVGAPDHRGDNAHEDPFLRSLALAAAVATPVALAAAAGSASAATAGSAPATDLPAPHSTVVSTVP